MNPLMLLCLLRLNNRISAECPPDRFAALLKQAKQTEVGERPVRRILKRQHRARINDDGVP